MFKISHKVNSEAGELQEVVVIQLFIDSVGHLSLHDFVFNEDLAHR